MKLSNVLVALLLAIPIVEIQADQTGEAPASACAPALLEPHPDIVSTWVRANVTWPQMELGIAYSMLATLMRLGPQEKERYLSLPLGEMQLDELLLAMDRAHAAYKIEPTAFRDEPISVRRARLKDLWVGGKN